MPADKCKLPVYLSHDPSIWFKAVEAAFLTHKVVKSSERASLVVSALPEEQLQAVAYLLGDEEDTQVYEEIKAALIEMDGPSLQESMERFLALPVLRPGERPSSIRRQLCSWVSEDQVESSLVRALFISKMPADLKKLLLNQENLSLRHLAAHADKLQRTSGLSSPPGSVFCVETLEDPICPSEAAGETVNAVRGPRQQHRRFKTQPTPPSPLEMKAGILSPAGVCHFHTRFGKAARSCVSGCKWNQGNAAGAGGSL